MRNFKTNPQYLETKQSEPCFIHSNVWTVKAIIRPILTYANSEGITSIGNSMLRNIKNSRNLKINQFAQLWAVIKHDFKKSQAFFTKCLEEQNSYRQYSRILHIFWYSFHSGTPIVRIAKNRLYLFYFYFYLLFIIYYLFWTRIRV